ncbi:MAG: DUF3888 domain-containing protein [Clostridia bacterium]|nr:DUF3888 domain-containing protein [Clostridia bacterium]MDD4375676.1 DUF3888 domain-containing protein [Clostridia bacterium]
MIKKDIILLISLFILLIIFYIIISSCLSTYSTVISTNIDNSKCENQTNFILAFLNPYIYDSLKSHYGEIQNFDLFDAEILKIEDHTYQGYSFKITISVTSFIGAHLLNFNTNTITYTLDSTGVYETAFTSNKI